MILPKPDFLFYLIVQLSLLNLRVCTLKYLNNVIRFFFYPIT